MGKMDMAPVTSLKVPENLDDSGVYTLSAMKLSTGLWHWTINSGTLLWSADSGSNLNHGQQVNGSGSLEDFNSRVHPDDRERVANATRNHITKNEPYDLIYRHANDEGGYDWIRAIGIAECNAKGKATRMAGIFVNVSHEIQLRRELSRKEHELEMVFDHVPAKIWLKNAHNQIVLMNENAAKYVNVKDRHKSPVNVYDIDPNRAKQYHEEDLRVIATGEPTLERIEEYITDDGELRYMSTDKIPFEDDITGEKMVLVISSDITKLKRAKQKLKRYIGELEVLNKDLDNFAYIASHDLKAPLRGMNNLLLWIEEDLGDTIQPDIKDKLHLLRGRVARMGNLLDDILKFSRAGKKDIQSEEVDTNKIIAETLAWLTPPKEFKVVTKNELPTLYISKTIIHQIFLNLIGNAIKHHDKKSANISISSEETNTEVTFMVEDDGPGIPKEFHDQVFEMFKKLESRDNVEGSGIGLTITRKLIDSLGGDIRIESPVKMRGTRFIFSIPKKQKDI